MGHAIWLPVPAPRRGTELDRREYSDRRPPFSTTTVPHPKNHLPHPDVLPRRRDVGYRGLSREQATPRDERHVPTKTGGDHGSRPSPCSAEGRPAPTATDRSGSDANRWIPIAGWTWPSPEPPTACRPATPFRHTWPGTPANLAHALAGTSLHSRQTHSCDPVGPTSTATCRDGPPLSPGSSGCDGTMAASTMSR